MATQRKVSASNNSPAPKGEISPAPQSATSSSTRESKFECKVGSIYTSSPVVKAGKYVSERFDAEENGKKFTTYVVQLENKAGIKWKVYRRYRDFEAVFLALKDKVPELSNFKFPNKSKFNTHSDHTIERRVAGFDEFVGILVSLNNSSPEFCGFIEPTDNDLYISQPSAAIPLRKIPKQEKRKTKTNYGICVGHGLPLAVLLSALYIAVMTFATIYLKKEKTWGITNTLFLLIGFWTFFLWSRSIIIEFEKAVCPKCRTAKCPCGC